jgi:hypothetical protein
MTRRDARISKHHAKGDMDGLRISSQGRARQPLGHTHVKSFIPKAQADTGSGVLPRLLLPVPSSDEEKVLLPSHQLPPKVKNGRAQLAPAVLDFGANPKLQPWHFGEVTECFVGYGGSESSREGIGLLNVDELKARARVGHHDSEAQGDCR